MWRGGCIIRSAFLGDIKKAFDPRAGPGQPAARSVLPGRGHEPAGGLAPRDRRRRAEWHPGAVSEFGAFRTSTAIVPSGCRRICCRRSATTSARTRTSASISRVARFFHTNWTGHGGTTTSGKRVQGVESPAEARTYIFIGRATFSTMRSQRGPRNGMFAGSRVDVLLRRELRSRSRARWSRASRRGRDAEVLGGFLDRQSFDFSQHDAVATVPASA